MKEERCLEQEDTSEQCLESLETRIRINRHAILDISAVQEICQASESCSKRLVMQKIIVRHKVYHRLTLHG